MTLRWPVSLDVMCTQLGMFGQHHGQCGAAGSYDTLHFVTTYKLNEFQVSSLWHALWVNQARTIRTSQYHSQSVCSACRVINTTAQLTTAASQLATKLYDTKQMYMAFQLNKVQLTALSCVFNTNIRSSRYWTSTSVPNFWEGHRLKHHKI